MGFIESFTNSRSLLLSTYCVLDARHSKTALITAASSIWQGRWWSPRQLQGPHTQEGLSLDGLEFGGEEAK